jgi:multiple sugar transport system substrate-binding protein
MSSNTNDRDGVARRRVLAGLAGGAAAGLAGCSARGPAGGDGDGGDGSGGGGGEGVTLTYHDRDDTYSNYADPFNGAHDGITVEESIEPDDARYKSVIAEISAGNAPEVIGLDVVRLAQFADLGALADLSDWAPSLDYWDDVFEPLRRDFVQYQGTTYALPFWLDCSMYHYNKAHFEEAGLDPESPPETWSEFRSACEALDGAGYTPVAASFDGGLTEFFWYPFPWSNGAELLNEDNSATNFDSSAAVEALELWVDLNDAGYTTDLVAGEWTTFHNKFLNGDASMCFGSAFTSTFVRENDREFFDNDLGASMYPMASGGIQQTFIGGNSIVISKQAAQDEAVFSAAKEFVEWSNSEEGMTRTLENGGLPGRERGFELASDRPEPAYPVAREALGKGHAPPIHPKYEQIADPFRTAVEEALLGERTADEALKSAASRVNSILSG